ncbi:MAG: glycosyltransferase family 4 protein [Candidatus Bathyarchaeia archaeon]
MNVCFITPEYYPISGGTGSYVYYLSKMLVKRDNSVFIVTKGNKYKKERVNTNLGIMQIKVSEIPLIGPLLFFRRSGKSLKELGMDFQVDVAHANLPLIPSFAIPKGFGKTLISTVHSTWEGEAKALEKEPFGRLNLNEKVVRCFRDFLKFFEHRLLRRSDMIIAVSEFTKKEILKNYDDVPSGKIRVIHNGVDVERFSPAKDKSAFKRKFGFRNEDLLILYVGRLYSRKGLPTLIEAIPKVAGKFNDVKFIISGKGLKDEENKLRCYAKKLGVEEKLIFLGYFPDEALPDLYRAADMFVFPSIYENLPFAMLEAMASGLPVITTTVGGIPEVIQDGKNGFMIDPYNSVALAERILYLIENPKVAYEMGFSGRETVERKFSWEGITRQVLQVYIEAIAKRQ